MSDRPPAGELWSPFVGSQTPEAIEAREYAQSLRDREAGWYEARDRGYWVSGNIRVDFDPDRDGYHPPVDIVGPIPGDTGRYAHEQDAARGVDMITRNVRCSVCSTLLGIFYGREDEWNAGRDSAHCDEHLPAEKAAPGHGQGADCDQLTTSHDDRVRSR